MADAAEETTEVVEETTTVTTATDEDSKWKALSRKNERELKQARAELEKLKAASMSEQEQAVAQARAEGRESAAAEVRLERVRDKIEAKAAGKLADPEDAAALLGDLNQFVKDDGTIDSQGIGAAIDQLVKTKPYLAPGPGNGSGEGGPRGTSTQSTTADPLLDSLTRAVGGSRTS